ncbi:MAG: DUF429 domain-containing protein [Thermodesulfobacteriota bacterium]
MIAGVDGCRGGWLVALAEGWPCPAPPRLAICNDFRTVLDATADCAAVAVDMPVGLPDGGEGRDCDRAARALLKARRGAAGRVFPSPPRTALQARTWPELQELHHSIAGKGVPKQVWNIAPRLREVDAALTPDLQSRVVEAHPELAFARLAGRVLASKHASEGLEERRAALAAASPHVLPALEGIPSGSALDDALDALALLAVATHVAEVGIEAAPDAARRVPALPFGDIPRDTRGLRMEIWY